MKSKSQRGRPGCAPADAAEGNETPGCTGSWVGWECCPTTSRCQLIRIHECSPASFSGTLAETPVQQKKRSFKDTIRAHEESHTDTRLLTQSHDNRQTTCTTPETIHLEKATTTSSKSILFTMETAAWALNMLVHTAGYITVTHLQ